MDRDKEVRDGQWAEQLLKDERWNRVWDGYRLKLYAAIETAKTDEATLAGKKMLLLLNDVRRDFETMLKTGKVAEHEIRLKDDEKKKGFWPWAA